MNSAEADKKDAIPPNLRPLVLLEEIARAGVPVTPTNMMDRIDLPKPTVQRLFATLESHGFLQRELNGRSYTPGLRLRRLTTNVFSSMRMQTNMVGILQALAERIGETCNVAAPDRAGMIYIERAETKWPLRIQLPIGSAVPFHCTASGKAYLSTLGRARLERLLGNMRLESYSPNTITDRRKLMEELQRAGEEGWAQDNEEFIEGMIGIAVPISDRQGKMFSTLSLHAPSQRLSLKSAQAHVPLLRETAERLSELVIGES
ncbi:IclR family transcriptional regulator [Afifella sp. IM 167]|uniref:IclR family transcriptional regulator n=1 Tax=Afifella sp. IM 167 TaxID=2033586 RepID=UPI001CCD1AB9|nr:IclR family transcriptional regulator [Afifella sp. IM 167]